MPHAPALLVLALLSAACAKAPSSAPSPQGDRGPIGSPAAIAAEVVRYTNDARARNGLSALRSNAKLMEAARLHASQMAAHNLMEHTIPRAKYPTMVSRLEAVGYDYSLAAENVAWNQRSAQAVVTTWMNSTGHRRNILNRELTEIGVAIARNARGEPYWIQVFGTPR
jgi:uncharacterized protein YkwD